MDFLQLFHAARRPESSPAAGGQGMPEVEQEEELYAAVVDGPEPGWYPDPMGEYPMRWWSGEAWTSLGSVDGAQVCEAADADELPAEVA